MPEKVKKPEAKMKGKLFENEFPSDAEIGEVVIDRLEELGYSREEAEARLVKWNREHGI
jgi:hypothetical protein